MPDAQARGLEHIDRVAVPDRAPALPIGEDAAADVGRHVAHEEVASLDRLPRPLPSAHHVRDAGVRPAGPVRGVRAVHRRDVREEVGRADEAHVVGHGGRAVPGLDHEHRVVDVVQPHRERIEPARERGLPDVFDTRRVRDGDAVRGPRRLRPGGRGEDEGGEEGGCAHGAQRSAPRPPRIPFHVRRTVAGSPLPRRPPCVPADRHAGRRIARACASARRSGGSSARRPRT